MVINEIQNGGQDLFGFDAGLRHQNETTGLLSATTPTVRIVGSETANIGGVGFTQANDFVFTTDVTGDAGTNANRIVSALFMNRPGNPNAAFTATAVDQNTFVRYQGTDIDGNSFDTTRLVPTWYSNYICNYLLVKFQHLLLEIYLMILVQQCNWWYTVSSFYSDI